MIGLNHGLEIIEKYKKREIDFRSTSLSRFKKTLTRDLLSHQLN